MARWSALTTGWCHRDDVLVELWSILCNSCKTCRHHVIRNVKAIVAFDGSKLFVRRSFESFIDANSTFNARNAKYDLCAWDGIRRPQTVSKNYSLELGEVSNQSHKSSPFKLVLYLRYPSRSRDWTIWTQCAWSALICWADETMHRRSIGTLGWMEDLYHGEAALRMVESISMGSCIDSTIHIVPWF